MSRWANQRCLRMYGGRMGMGNFDQNGQNFNNPKCQIILPFSFRLPPPNHNQRPPSPIPHRHQPSLPYWKPLTPLLPPLAYSIYTRIDTYPHIQKRKQSPQA